MPTLTMTKGLPASGKTTWAKKQNAKRVNKDDLRAMIDDGKWSKENEKLILKARDKLINLYLLEGYDVIVDDTNLHAKHESTLDEMAQDYQIPFEVKDFTDVPLKTCIERDLGRSKPVGKKVITQMYNQFIKQHVAQYPGDPELPDCIIVDIDGTLAHMTGRSPYDYSRVGEDQPDQIVRGIVCKYYYDRNIQEQELPTAIIIVSGREAGCREVTETWLYNNYIPYDQFYMRAFNDNRDDRIVKREIFDREIRGKYNVKFVLDDRDRVVEMWRGLGLKVLQVAEGDF